MAQIIDFNEYKTKKNIVTYVTCSDGISIEHHPQSSQKLIDMLYEWGILGQPEDYITEE